MSWTCGGKETCHWRFFFYISGHQEHQALSVYYKSGKAACPASPVIALLSSSTEQTRENSTVNKNTFNKEILHPDIWPREVKQPINKTIPEAIDIVVFWVAFGLSQHRRDRGWWEIACCTKYYCAEMCAANVYFTGRNYECLLWSLRPETQDFSDFVWKHLLSNGWHSPTQAASQVSAGTNLPSSCIYHFQWPKLKSIMHTLPALTLAGVSPHN